MAVNGAMQGTPCKPERGVAAGARLVKNNFSKSPDIYGFFLQMPFPSDITLQF